MHKLLDIATVYLLCDLTAQYAVTAQKAIIYEGCSFVGQGEWVNFYVSKSVRYYAHKQQCIIHLTWFKGNDLSCRPNHSRGGQAKIADVRANINKCHSWL